MIFDYLGVTMKKETSTYNIEDIKTDYNTSREGLRCTINEGLKEEHEDNGREEIK